MVPPAGVASGVEGSPHWPKLDGVLENCEFVNHGTFSSKSRVFPRRRTEWKVIFIGARAAIMPEQRQLDEDLWNAAADGKLDAVKDLKAQGANVNWVHPWLPEGRATQFTSLHIASDHGHLDVVKWLVDKGGASLNSKAAFGETPLDHVAGRTGMGEVRVPRL